jgi:hypothetical protein
MQPLLLGCSDFSDRKRNTAQNSPVAAMPGSKEESKDGPPVVSELHVKIKHMQTKKHGRQCHAFQCNRAKKKKRDTTKYEPRFDD